MLSVFVRPKPCRVMLLLRDSESPWHLSRLAKSSDTSYVYVTKLVGKLLKDGLVSVETKGKKRVVKLTEKGTVVANTIHELMAKLQG